jgi:hypothetical protein
MSSMPPRPHRVVDIDPDKVGEMWGCACGWRGPDMHEHRMHVKEVDSHNLDDVIQSADT